jgi:catechol 2,3-dioxygenase-like lactoylglutathione lyase family enzyme
MSAQFPIESLDHVAIRVRDVGASAAWYERVLGMRTVFEGQWDGVPVFLLVRGASKTGIAIFPRKADAADPPAGAHRAIDHFAFRVSGEGFEAAKAHLDAIGQTYSVQDREVAVSLYMRDPDGIVVELTTYDVGGSLGGDRVSASFYSRLGSLVRQRPSASCGP